MAINWMQRHKKWLIVTIWVSTIAFIGAGFVGWGSYNYGKSDGTVATVGDKEIPMKDLQQEYNSLYSQYQTMFRGKFNQEMAKQLGLENAALQKVIDKYLLLNYAYELGLMTTDKEVVEELVKIKAFQKNGKFDKNTYLQVLKQNRRTATEFEAGLKQDLLIGKVQRIFSLKPEKNEIDNLGSILFAKSKVAIEIINGNNIKINPTIKELQKFYNEHKNNYKSPAGFEVGIKKVENLKDKDEKGMKKVALRQYLALKKGEEKFSKTETTYDLTTLLNKDTIQSFQQAADGDVLKPFYKDNNFYIVQKIKSIAPQVLAFEDVKSQVNKAYILAQKGKILEEKGKKALDNFKGKELGFIDRNSELNLPELTKDESEKVLQSIFNATKKKDFINLKDKVVVYDIEDTKLGKIDAKDAKLLVSTIQNYKSNAVSSKLIEQLQNRYDIKSYLTK